MVADLEERIAFELAATPEAGSAARRALLAGNGALPSSVPKKASRRCRHRVLFERGRRTAPAHGPAAAVPETG
jgi:hypothetical protein